MANHTADEAKFKLSPFWAWVVRWVARTAKYILIVPILMGIGYWLCASGQDFNRFVMIAFWVFVAIAILVAAFGSIWQKNEKFWLKSEKPVVKEKEQPTSAKVETTDVSESPAYKWGFEDFLNSNDSRDMSKLTPPAIEEYRQGYTAALFEHGLEGRRA